MADVFEDRLQRSLKSLETVEEVRDRISVPEENRFIGFDAYQKLLATNIDIVLLTTPPAFRPLHYAAAIAAGKHVFMEKPCCLDGPGYRLLMDTNKLADDKNLKVVVGLQRRHQASYVEGIKRIHDGEVGDIILIRTYFNMPAGGPNYDRRPEGMTEMEWQIRRWNMFTWLSGDHIVEQAVHEIDIANWMKKDEPPVKANGLGGRQVRIGWGNGQIFDHHFVEYVYADGSRHFAQAKQQPGGWSHVSDNVHGTRGMLTVGSGPYGMGGSADYSGGESCANRRGGMVSPYRQEHQDLVDAIRNGRAAQRWLSRGEEQYDRRVRTNGDVLRRGDYLGAGDSIGSCPLRPAWSNTHSSRCLLPFPTRRAITRLPSRDKPRCSKLCTPSP